MFLLAGFNPRGHRIAWAYVRCGDGAPRWTRLYRFSSGDFAWIGARLGWARFQPDWIGCAKGMNRWEMPDYRPGNWRPACDVVTRQEVRTM